MPDRDPLDRLLDDALTTYANPGPALAPSVLAHIAARNAASRLLPAPCASNTAS